MKMTSRQAAIQVKKQRPDYDRDAYSRGYKSSRNSTGGGFPLEAADARGEPNEWYDGYSDAASCLEKWHRPLCDADVHDVGGCTSEPRTVCLCGAPVAPGREDCGEHGW